MVLQKQAILLLYYNAVDCFGNSIRNKSGRQIFGSAGLLQPQLGQ
jgi:hypothetical protein